MCCSLEKGIAKLKRNIIVCSLRIDSIAFATQMSSQLDPTLMVVLTSGVFWKQAGLGQRVLKTIKSKNIMKYTIFEHLKLPNKGLRFFTMATDDQSDSEFWKIVGHADSIEKAQSICRDYDTTKLPDISEVMDYHVHKSGIECAKFEMQNYMFALSDKSKRW